ncbi:hypothetical protein V3H19_22440 [Vibrio parahaemolyticus]|uniref:hypothetical protein n=1 Tax=Vibrio parahaemolyticus TaxID=670 RepID=UPI003B685F4B
MRLLFSLIACLLSISSYASDVTSGKQPLGEEVAVTVEQDVKQRSADKPFVIDDEKAAGFDSNIGVSCGFGRTCKDNQRCCIVGSSHWCCSNKKSCDYDNIGCK